MKNIGCIGCHQIGQEATRTIPAQFGNFKSGDEAWMRRVQSGQSGEQMINQLAGQWGGAPFKYLGDWTDRIAKGELPKDKPPRPQGVERNLVDHRVGVEHARQVPPRPDLVRQAPSDGECQRAAVRLAGVFDRQHADPRSEDQHGVVLQDAGAGSGDAGVARPGPCGRHQAARAVGLLGRQEAVGHAREHHNSMFDDKGRVWLAATVRGMDNPAWCKKGSDNQYAKVFPLEKSPRQAAVLDPKTMKYSFVDTCFATHHPQFGFDKDNTPWFSGTGPVAGWVNTRVFDETGDSQKAVGWAPFVLDTDGNGKLDAYVEPNQPAEPNKDKRIVPGSGPYAVMPHPTDGSIWYTVGVFGGPPGFLRFDPNLITDC